jgi:hypothetical protein
MGSTPSVVKMQQTKHTALHAHQLMAHALSAVKATTTTHSQQAHFIVWHAQQCVKLASTSTAARYAQKGTLKLSHSPMQDLTWTYLNVLHATLLVLLASRI